MHGTTRTMGTISGRPGRDGEELGLVLMVMLPADSVREHDRTGLRHECLKPALATTLDFGGPLLSRTGTKSLR